ncbi:hypothetical protein BSKO_03946 [Bryopsis sp. KO-2023]|nr:hypothetical protein BSKO_03946 [Bryopsis sp. KO-2023]
MKLLREMVAPWLGAKSANSASSSPENMASVSVSQQPLRNPMVRMSGIVPNLMYRALTISDTRDLAAVQAPWLGARDLVSRALNGGIHQAFTNFVHRGPLQDETTMKARSSGRRRGNSRREARLAWEDGLEYERALDLEGAIESMSRAMELSPDDVMYVARLSKQYSDMSYVDGVKYEDAKTANKKALDLAEKALACDPNHVLGHIAMCVSKGRLATFCDNRTKVHLAREAEDSVKEALQIDPKCDIAHHLMGRWNYEMAGLNALARTFVRIVYGTTLSTGSYSGALDCFLEASQLAPQRIIHKVQLGKTYQKLGDKEKAVQHLEEAMSLEMQDINDYLEQREAGRMLERLKGTRKMPWRKPAPLSVA